MKKSKLLAMLLVSVLSITTFYQVPVNAQVSNLVSSNTIETEAKIDELHKLRKKYLLEDNSAAVASIDNQLQNLGVQKMNAREALNKINGANTSNNVASPYIAVPSNGNGVTWSSSTSLATYNGKQYWVQVIRAYPTSNTGGSLLSKKEDYNVKTNYGATLGAVKVLQVFASSVAGNIPQIGGTISNATTLWDALNGFLEGASPVSSVECNGSYHMNACIDYKYIFVKENGAANGKEVLCYVGNDIEMAVTTVYMCNYMKNGSLYPENITRDYYVYITSPYYSDWVSTACSNFLIIKNNPGAVVGTSHIVSSYTFTMFGTQTATMVMPQLGNFVYY